MKLFYEKFAAYSLLRAAVFGVMGIVTLLFAEFLQGPVFYVVVGYVLVCGIWGAADYLLYSKETSAPMRYASLAAAVLMIGFSVFSIIYGRYFVHIAPLYLAGLILVNGLVYFLAALFSGSNKSWILISLAVCIFWGGVAVVLFIFGFGFGGLLGTQRVCGVVLQIVCVYELTAYMIDRKAAKSRMEREEIQ